MNRLFLVLALALSSVSVDAQVLADGYYRVQNTNTKRWAVLADNKAYVDRSASSAGASSVNLEALRTYMSFDDHIVSNPASVIKFTYNSAGRGYVLGAQGTDTYTMLKPHGNFYLDVRRRGNTYYASATYEGITIRLCDDILEGDAMADSMSYAQPTGNATSYWNINKVDASTSDYFGFKPTISLNGKYYLPFYAGFGFSNYSDGIHAYYVDNVIEDKGIAELREITSNVKPAGLPMIIETTSESPSSNKINVVDGGAMPSGNKLTGVYFCSAKDMLAWYDQPAKDHDVYTLNDPSTMRVLGVNNGQLVLKKSTEKYISANSFYLKVSSTCPDVIRLLSPSEFTTTGINEIHSEDSASTADENVYNLNGQRVSTTGLQSLPHGIYIYKGKKVVKD